MSLEMRVSCERCGTGLVPDGPALVCSHERTYGEGCADALDRVCPDREGELAGRPRRQGR